MEQQENFDLVLMNDLKCIKDRCSPPEKFWFKTYYAILFLLSCVPLVAHNMAFGGMDFNLMRMSHGLLPIQALMMRNTVIPYLVPAMVLSSAFLSIWFKKLRSAGWLAVIALAVIILMSVYLLLIALFTMSFTIEFTKR